MTRKLAARARGGAAVAHVARSHRLDRSETMSEDAALPLSFGLPREAPARRSEPSASRPEPPSRRGGARRILSFAAAPPLPTAPSAWDADDEVCRDETNWCERDGSAATARRCCSTRRSSTSGQRSITPRRRAARAGAVARVRALASELWPRSRVASFVGLHWLHLPTSDIDLAVLGTGLRKSEDEKVRARQLAAAVRRALETLARVVATKVPILRFDDDATNVSIDVCIEEDGLKSSALCRKVPPPSPKHAPHHHRHHHRRRRRRRHHHCRHRPLRNPTRRPPPSRRSATSYSC